MASSGRAPPSPPPGFSVEALNVYILYSLILVIRSFGYYWILYIFLVTVANSTSL